MLAGHVACAYNPSYLGGRDTRIAPEAILGEKKATEKVVQRTNWVWWFMPVIPATQGAQVGGFCPEQKA
jgi:hypothetical protein